MSKKPVNPLDQKKAANENSDLINSIVSTETGEGGAPILEEAPELDSSLLQDVKPQKSILLLVLKILFWIGLSLTISSFLFFSSQLTNWFDFASNAFNIPNVSEDLSSTNAEVINLQTNINFYRYLKLKAYLDEFSFHGDFYIQNFEIANSQTATNTDKNNAINEMSLVTAPLKEAFEKSQDVYKQKFAVQLVDESYSDQSELLTLFEERLKEKFSNEANRLASDSDPEAVREYRNYIQAMELVGNSKLKDMILNSDFDAITDSEVDLYEFIKNVNSLVVNDLSSIQEIKEMRIKWSDIIKEIELRTIAVDAYYSEDLYAELGGIRYTSYDFDASGPRITISGETKRIDTTNFTMISDLIDELNSSLLFENAEMRSFSKSGSLEEGYTATLKLTLDLQEISFSFSDKTIDVDEIPAFLEKSDVITR